MITESSSNHCKLTNTGGLSGFFSGFFLFFNVAFCGSFTLQCEEGCKTAVWLEKEIYVLGLLFRHCCSIRLERRELYKLINNRNKIQAVGCSYNCKEDHTITAARSLV